MNLIGISRKVEDLLLLFSDKQIDGGCWWLLVVFISMGMNQRILRYFCSGWLFDMWPATMIHCQISSFLCRVRSPCHRHMPWLEGPQIQTQTLVLFGLFATCESLLKGKGMSCRHHSNIPQAIWGHRLITAQSNVQRGLGKARKLTLNAWLWRKICRKPMVQAPKIMGFCKLSLLIDCKPIAVKQVRLSGLFIFASPLSNTSSTWTKVRGWHEAHEAWA